MNAEETSIEHEIRTTSETLERLRRRECKCGHVYALHQYNPHHPAGRGCVSLITDDGGYCQCEGFESA